MFVLLRSYELTSPSLSVEERIGLTMERGGVSILFTSVTDLVAFGIGSTSIYGSVSAFCAFCSVGVCFDFIFQITFFLGFMVLDSRWNASISNDFSWSSCLCCCFNKNKNATCGSCKKNSASTNNSTNNRYNNKSSSIIGHLINDEASSTSMELVGKFILGDVRVSIGVILLFIGYVAGGVYGITTLNTFQDPVDLAPNDSYLRDFYKVGEVKHARKQQQNRTQQNKQQCMRKQN